MLTAAENKLLTEIEPGARMGALLRRFWQPLGAASEMEDRWTKRLRVFGEDLRGLQGPLGRLRTDRRSLPASPRIVRLRYPDRRRNPLPLSRLAVRRRRPLHRTAERTPRKQSSKIR